MSLEMRLGKRGNLLEPGPDSYAQVSPFELDPSSSTFLPVYSFCIVDPTQFSGTSARMEAHVCGTHAFDSGHLPPGVRGCLLSAMFQEQSHWIRCHWTRRCC